MEASDADRRGECRALGAVAGIAAGVAFWAYFMEQIFKVTQKSQLFEIEIIGGALVLSILAFALGAGGFVGRLIGQYIIFPIRTGNDAGATKVMIWLMVGGLVAPAFVFLLAVLLGGFLAQRSLG